MSEKERIYQLLDALSQEIDDLNVDPDDSDETPVENTNMVDTIPWDTDRPNGPPGPLIMVRDSVKDSRTGGHLQIDLYPQTDEMMLNSWNEIDVSFEDKLSKMDFNESVLLAGLMNLDDVYRVMKTWGYDQGVGDLDYDS